MNSLYIMSKQSKAVDVLVSSSCCCCSFDLKAGEKKVGREKSPVPVITPDSRLHFCTLHLLCLFVLPLFSTSVQRSELAAALRSLAVLGRARARARQMRCVC